jgi:hypothetical protein
MTRRNESEFGKFGQWQFRAIGAVVLAFGLAACSTISKTSASEPTASSSNQAADSAPPPGPEAKIQISYSHPDDFLKSLSLTKYSGATVLATEPAGANGIASVVRFEGGTPTWEIKDEPGMFSEMPLRYSAKTYAVSEVRYGKVPPHFEQIIPDTGPPEPLQPNHFYIFSVTRMSGSISYDAVKANADGSLQAYEADPRAGSSFRLCCNISPDFPATTPSSAFDALSAPSGALGP